MLNLNNDNSEINWSNGNPTFAYFILNTISSKITKLDNPTCIYLY